uniref:DH domain-containing protein n=1 Tax=Malurus cyaneus samueli TaxID=2593467 RepID=A0A8C5U3R6_9PASS
MSDAEEATEEATEEVMPSDKMELSQRLAVEELITTEASYVHNLQLCVSDIRAHLQKKQLPELDLEGLFSNTDDILHMSQRFLKGLEDTAGRGQEQLLSISKCCSPEPSTTSGLLSPPNTPREAAAGQEGSPAHQP